MGGRRFGVEEELLLVDPDTGRGRAVSGPVLADTEPDGVGKELQQEQLETDTAPVTTLDGMDREIRRLRQAAADAAVRQGARIAALATSPLPISPTLTPDRRYERMVDLYRLTAGEQLTCGMHVHVEVDSPDEGVAVLDRIRPWLPVLRAMSANSPFWQGQDTGYESFRTQAWSRWPAAGSTGVFGSLAAYRRVVQAALATGTLLDVGMLYFDARLGHGLPTVEVRVADVCLYAADALLLAALSRALVETAVRDWQERTPSPDVPTEVVTLAHWRASRSGLAGRLVHPATGTEAPAWDAVAAIRAHVADALDDAGDTATVDTLLTEVRRRGTGAAVQRSVFARSDDLTEVVRDAVRRTVT